MSNQERDPLSKDELSGGQALSSSRLHVMRAHQALLKRLLSLSDEQLSQEVLNTGALSDTGAGASQTIYQKESSPVVHTHLLVSLCMYLGASSAETREVLGSEVGAALNCYYSDVYQRSSGVRTAGKRL